MSQVKYCRPDEGDVVVVLSTEYTKKYCPDVIDKMVAIRSVDDQPTVPYQISGNDVAWLGDSMLRFVRTSVEAHVRDRVSKFIFALCL